MIIKLSGTVDEVYTNTLILNVNNVFYELNVSELHTKKIKKKKGGKITVSVFHLITENSQSLYGFENEEDRNFFKYLISLKGLGGSSVIKMFSAMNPSDIASLLYNNDVENICKLPSIGKKTAEKILLEFKGTIKKFDLTGINKSDYNPEVIDKAVEALISIGFEKTKVFENVKGVYVSGMNVSELVNIAIKKIK